jgi:hypothetical protein
VHTRARRPGRTRLVGWLAATLAGIVLVVNAGGVTAQAPDRLTSIQLVGASSNSNSGANQDFQLTDGGGARGLFPGAVKPLRLSVTNPYNFDIKVTALTVTLTAKASTDKAGCANTAQNLQPGTYTGPSFVVPDHRTVAAPADIPITMPRTVAAACQDAAFPLSYGGTATKVNK